MSSFGIPTSVEGVQSALINARNYMGNGVYSLLTRVIPSNHVDRVFNNVVWTNTFGSSNPMMKNGFHAATWVGAGTATIAVLYWLLPKVYNLANANFAKAKEWYYGPTVPKTAAELAQEKSARREAKVAADAAQAAKIADLETQIDTLKGNLLNVLNYCEQVDGKTLRSEDTKTLRSEVEAQGRTIRSVYNHVDNRHDKQDLIIEQLKGRVQDLTTTVMSLDLLVKLNLSMKGASQEQVDQIAKMPEVVARQYDAWVAAMDETKTVAASLHAQLDLQAGECKKLAQDRGELNKDITAFKKQEKAAQKQHKQVEQDLQELNQLRRQVEILSLEKDCAVTATVAKEQELLAQQAGDAKQAAAEAVRLAQEALDKVASKKVVNAAVLADLKQAAVEAQTAADKALLASQEADKAVADADPTLEAAAKDALEQTAQDAKNDLAEKRRLLEDANNTVANVIDQAVKTELEETFADAEADLDAKTQLAITARQEADEAADGVRVANEALDKAVEAHQPFLAAADKGKAPSSSSSSKDQNLLTTGPRKDTLVLVRP